jgi:transcriptional regulator with XRE-family HTH domain
MANRLKELREEKGWTHDRAAKECGMSRGHFIKLERGERRLNSHNLELFSKAFGVSQSDILTVKLVPVVGKVRAGESIEMEDANAQGPFDYVHGPEGTTDATVAVEIEGDSLGPAFHDWRIFYDDIRTPPTPDMFGRLCVVALPNGKVLVKVLKPGSGTGLYTLVPQFGSPLFDQTVVWAALVKALMPR